MLLRCAEVHTTAAAAFKQKAGLKCDRKSYFFNPQNSEEDCLLENLQAGHEMN